VLNSQDVLPYLIGAGVIPGDSDESRDLAVRDVSRRNRNFHVAGTSGGAYILKQGSLVDERGGLATEAAAYGWLWASDPEEANHVLPCLASYDAGRDILVTSLAARAEDLGRYHALRGRFPAEIGRQVGAALAWVHSRSLAGPPVWPLEDLGIWVLEIHRPTLDAYRSFSGGNVELVRAIQSSPDLCSALDRLNADRRHDAPVHNDVKWDNMVVIRPGPGARRRVRLIDWELAARGDPRWDVGAALAAYLTAWLLSIPLARDRSLAELSRMARQPLESTHRATAALWNAYRTRSGLSGRDERHFVVRAVEFAAARLLQTAFEISALGWTLAPHAALLLQVGANILARPTVACPSLFGL
jgi:hypothetical protein